VVDADLLNINYLEVAPSAGPENQAPEVAIISPSEGVSFVALESINFSGSATDDEDGDLTQGLVWSSSRDGELGTEGTVQAALSAGEHVVSLVATDSQGLVGSAAVKVNVVNLVLGDANQDGQFTGEDIYLVVDWVIGRQPRPDAGRPAFMAGDADGDGSITANDVALLIDRLSEAPGQSSL
jgi:Dockerin type I domain